MTDKTATNGDGERLLAQLRLLSADVDPVPPEVTSFANAALGWRRIDASLAELLSDSLLESEAATFARSEVPRERAVTFRGSDLDVDLEIHDVDRGVVLLGQIAPAAKAEVYVQRDDTSLVASVEADELGRFRVELASGGRIRLLVRRKAPAPPVETSWIRV